MATAQATTEKTQPSSEATTSAAASKTQDQNFDLENVKLEDLPPEVQKFVKGFQKDYTQKTQSIAKDRKEWEARLAKATEWETWYQDNQGFDRR